MLNAPALRQSQTHRRGSGLLREPRLRNLLIIYYTFRSTLNNDSSDFGGDQESSIAIGCVYFFLSLTDDLY